MSASVTLAELLSKLVAFRAKKIDNSLHRKLTIVVNHLTGIYQAKKDKHYVVPASLT